jgi:hypothetical protein
MMLIAVSDETGIKALAFFWEKEFGKQRVRLWL